MPYYRKKPVVIEAIQYTGNNLAEVQEFTGEDKFSMATAEDPRIVATVWDWLHSTWVGVGRTDWIIKGVHGEFYPCENSVFEATYEFHIRTCVDCDDPLDEDDDTRCADCVYNLGGMDMTNDY